MGFNQIFKALQDIFPEIDSRVLRAVALEKQNDADAAVEVILTKVIPHLHARSRSLSNSPSPSRTSSQSPEVDNFDNKRSAVGANGTCSQQNAIIEHKTCSDEEQNSQLFHAERDHDQLLDDVHQMCGDSRTGSWSTKKLDQSPVSADLHVDLSLPISESETHFDHEKLQGPEFYEKKLPNDLQERCVELGIAENPESMLSSLEAGNSVTLQSDHVKDNLSDICSDRNKSAVQNFERYIEPSICDSLTVSFCDGNSVYFVARSEVPKSDTKESYLLKSDSAEIDSTNTLVDFPNGSTLNVGLGRPAQICCTDVLEDDISIERNNKKILFTALQSVIDLMRQVEAEENLAAEAKREASKGGLDILQRVEDLKEMLQHAKEANDMYAGEVNGEKAILATEVKELQSRLISLSDEKDRSLGILNEVRQSLEERVAKAKKEKEAAKKEKLEKEASVKKALVDQELIMERVVQEADILKQQAEENAELREFLVEHGHVVDMLQGEISVICQDVILLKRQFDERLPLSKSLTSSQTSCILASSSTMKSVVAKPVDKMAGQADSSEEAGKIDLLPCTIESPSSDSEATIGNPKVFSDEGWEVFDF